MLGQLGLLASEAEGFASGLRSAAATILSEEATAPRKW